MTIADSGFMMENGGSCLPYTPEQEKQIVDDLMNKSESNLREGNLYYVVSNRWFTSWQRYIGQGNSGYPINRHFPDPQHLDVLPSKTVERPGPIDNSDIVLKGNGFEDDDLEILRTLEEGRDYVLVPREVWEKLFDWYKGGPALPRKMISQGITHKKFMVEIYRLCLKLTDSRDNSQLIIRLSKKASVHKLYEMVCTLKAIEQEKARVWDYFNKRKQAILVSSNRTLEESNLQMDQDILLEVQQDGYWPSGFGMDSTGNELALVPMEPPRSSVSIAGGPTLSNGYSTVHTSNLYHGSALGHFNESAFPPLGREKSILEE